MRAERSENSVVAQSSVPADEKALLRENFAPQFESAGMTIQRMVESKIGKDAEFTGVNFWQTL